MVYHNRGSVPNQGGEGVYGEGRMRLHFPPSSTTLGSPQSRLKASVDISRHGAVAQSVERSPEKAGVGGSIPPCPTKSLHYSFTRLARRAQGSPPAMSLRRLWLYSPNSPATLDPLNVRRSCKVRNRSPGGGVPIVPYVGMAGLAAFAGVSV